MRQYRFAPPTGATTIVLVRHGESAPEHPDRPFPLRDGHGDPPLAPDGEEQARRVGERLASEHRAGLTIDAVYVTTLQRTHQTAAPLIELLARDGGVDVEPNVLADLREVFLGEWEQQFRAKVASGDPVAAAMFAEERWDVIPGAERGEDFAARLRAGVEAIHAAHPDSRVVAVVHGGVIGQLLAMATGSTPFAFVGADNASISELVVQADGRWRIRRFNDIAHLV
ncbi:histidine phosphatase family protein [Dermatobacter hominis]|uniref:histidine phosphatase family protein n=1 Tax=Dermatobacter hominis TaxID=2884263 RepID=UPI0035ABEDA2